MRDLSSADPPAPGPQDHRRGEAGSPSVVIYADFTCPQCALAAMALREKPVETVFRHMAISSRHRRSVPVAQAAEAAGAQGRFWDFHDSLFADQGRLDDPHLWERCRALGLDLDRFEADRRSAWALERVQAQTTTALRAGATGTPAFLVDGALTTDLADGLRG